MYTYGWFMLMFGRNKHNSVKILILKNKYIKKIFFKLKEIEDNTDKWKHFFFFKLCIMQENTAKWVIE